MIDPPDTETPVTGVLATAEAFAHAMDAGDAPAAGRLMATGCVCRDGTLAVVGPDAIVAMYRVAAGWAERGFDDVRTTTAIDATEGGAVRLAVRTWFMRVPGRWHRLHHARALTIDAAGHIVAIVHTCPRPAAEAFRAYARECGAGEPPPGYGA